jgi:hypothetical protein
MTEEKDWLDDLKVGDKVCYHSRYRGYEFETIDKITPTKQIKTKRYTFKNGYCRLDSWDGLHLEPITQKILDTVRAKKLLGEIKELRLEKLSLEQLERVYAIIHELDMPKAPESTEQARAEGGIFID